MPALPVGYDELGNPVFAGSVNGADIIDRYGKKRIRNAKGQLVLEPLGGAVPAQAEQILQPLAAPAAAPVRPQPLANSPYGPGVEAWGMFLPYITPEERATFAERRRAVEEDPETLGTTGQARGQQIVNEMMALNTTRAAQLAQEQRETTARKSASDIAKQRREVLRTELLGKIPEFTKQINENLINQQEYATKRIQPLIEQRLNALGLLQSGALPEAQARYQADLAKEREGALSDFELGQRQNLEFALPQQISEAELGDVREGLLGNIDLQRAALQRQFGLSDRADQNDLALAMNAQALAEARRQRQQALTGQLVGAGATLVGGALGGPVGAGLGGALAGYLANRKKQYFSGTTQNRPYNPELGYA